MYAIGTIYLGLSSLTVIQINILTLKIYFSTIRQLIGRHNNLTLKIRVTSYFLLQ